MLQITKYILKFNLTPLQFNLPNQSFTISKLYFKTIPQEYFDTIILTPTERPSRTMNLNQSIINSPIKKYSQTETQYKLNYQLPISQKIHITEGVVEDIKQTGKQQINYIQNIQIPKQNISQVVHPQSKQNNVNQISYKGQIDGLRAIAVILVVIFHAWPDFLPGGFIGVDIFFVISGYLITKIILKQIKNGKFSYFNFYSRRIRRIYPALLIVILFIFLVTYTKLPFYFQIQTYKKMSAATIFGANIESMTKKTGYFNPDQKTNPLLHLWSLGVEEQFYIIWPLVISLIVNKFSKKGLQVLIIFTVMSFFINILTIFKLDTKISFYFPLGRFWEMALGGILAYQRIRISSQVLSNVLSTVGISSAILCSFIINEKCLFPGFWALIPTLSASFIILAGQQSIINKIILSCRFFVAIGKISYPLYLWHWPLLVFSRKFYPSGSTSIFANPLIAIILAFILSFLTYKLIQKKIRYKKNKFIVKLLILMMIIVGLSSLCLIFILDQETLIDQKLYRPGINDFVMINGRQHANSAKNAIRQDPNKFKISIAMWDFQSRPFKVIDQHSKYYQNKQVKSLGQFRVLNEGQHNQLFLIGDSHSGVMAHRYYELYQQNLRKPNFLFPTIVNIMAHGKPFRKDFDYTDFSMDLIKKHRPQKVFFVHQWLFYLNKGDVTSKLNVQDFGKCIEQIKDLGIQVHVAGFHNIGQRFGAENAMDQNGPILQNIKSYSLSEFRNHYKQLIDPFQQTVLKAGGKFIQLNDNLCWQDVCQIQIPTGIPIYHDSNHYSRYYARHWLTSIDFLVQFDQK